MGVEEEENDHAGWRDGGLAKATFSD